MKLVSIVVPIYNVSKYLQECIESIICQTYKNIQIILVNDGSQDDSLKICQRYEKIDERIVVINKKNGGLVSARKAGVQKAEGEYITAIDGDDWIDSKYIEEIMEIVKNYDVDVVCTNCVYSYPNNKTITHNQNLCEGYYDKKKIEEIIYPFLIEDKKGNYFSNNICSKLFKKDIYLKHQMNVSNEIKIAEDAVCTKPIICECNSLYISNISGYFYRQNCESMTQKKVFDWDMPIKIYEQYMKTIDCSKQDFKEQIERNACHNIINTIVSQFNKPQKFNLIKKEIKENLNKKFYQDILMIKCKKSFKINIALFAIKYNLYWLLYVYNKIK